MFNFEKLERWHEAIAFADLVYQLTRKFPDEERFGLTNQMRRAAVSISSNIAEGSSRSSRTDCARFVEIATGSLFEVVSQSTVGRNQQFLTEAGYQQLYQAAEKQSHMLSAPQIPGILLTLNPQPLAAPKPSEGGSTLNLPVDKPYSLDQLSYMVIVNLARFALLRSTSGQTYC
jgi:four helix bundle protein